MRDPKNVKRSWHYWMYKWTKKTDYGSFVPDFDQGLLTENEFEKNNERPNNTQADQKRVCRIEEYSDKRNLAEDLGKKKVQLLRKMVPRLAPATECIIL